MRQAEAVAVEFDAPAAGTLRGQRFAGGDCWAVLVHDQGEDLDGWRGLATELVACGLSVLTFDLPGHGASDHPWVPELAVAAVASAVDFAGSQGARQVHMVAAGAGAMAALGAAAGAAPDVASAALLTPRLDHRVATLDRVSEARLPKLIIVGSMDPEAVRDAQALFRTAIGPCEMTRLPVSAQGTALLTGDWGQQAREKVLAHLVRWQRRLPG